MSSLATGRGPLTVLFVVPAQYFLDAPPAKASGAGSVTATRGPGPRNVDCEPYPPEKPITFDYGYLHYYVSAYMKSLIESVEIDGHRFEVTVLDEEFPESERSSGDSSNFRNGGPPAFDGYLGSAAEIRSDRRKMAFLESFDVIALSGQLHQISRAFELAELAREVGIAVLWGGVGVSAVYLENRRSASPGQMAEAWEKIVEAADSVVIGEAFYKVERSGERRYVIAEALADLLPVIESRGNGRGGGPGPGGQATVHDEFFSEGFSPENAGHLALAGENRDLPLPDYENTSSAFLHNVAGAQYRLGCRFNCSFCIVTRVQRQSEVRGHRKQRFSAFVDEIQRSTSVDGMSSDTIFFIDDDYFGIPVDDLLRLACVFKKRGMDYVVQGDVRTILTLRDSARILDRPRRGEVWALVKAPADESDTLLAADGTPVRDDTVFRVSTETADLLDRSVNPPDFDALWREAQTPMFEYLAANGLALVFMGLETIDQDELASLGKGTFQRVEKGYEAIRYLHSLKTLFVANMIVGGHGRGKGSGYGQHLVDLGIPLATVFVVTAYPGTPLWARARNDGTLYFPWETMGMDAFKTFDTMRGNLNFPGFDLYRQRDEALALNRVLFTDENIRARMAAYTPRLLRRRDRRRIKPWIGMLFHNFYYQRNVEKGLNAPYAGGLDSDEIPLVVEKALDCALDLAGEHGLPLYPFLDRKVLRGGLTRLAKAWLATSKTVNRVSSLYQS